MAELIEDLNRDTVTDALGLGAICLAIIIIMWLPALLAG